MTRDAHQRLPIQMALGHGRRIFSTAGDKARHSFIWDLLFGNRLFVRHNAVSVTRSGLDFRVKAQAVN